MTCSAVTSSWGFCAYWSIRWKTYSRMESNSVLKGSCGMSVRCRLREDTPSSSYRSSTEKKDMKCSSMASTTPLNRYSVLSSIARGDEGLSPISMSAEAVNDTPGKELERTSAMSCALWRKRRSGSFSSRRRKEEKW